MERKEFIVKCGLGCIGLMASSALLTSCNTLKYLDAPINGKFIEIATSAFVNADLDPLTFIVLRNEKLQYPIFVQRLNESQYSAVFMRCTHKGVELQAQGNQLSCPAHGSTFKNNGDLISGPANENLRSFPVIVKNEILKIDLS